MMLVNTRDVEAEARDISRGEAFFGSLEPEAERANFASASKIFLKISLILSEKVLDIPIFHFLGFHIQSYLVHMFQDAIQFIRAKI